MTAQTAPRFDVPPPSEWAETDGLAPLLRSAIARSEWPRGCPPIRVESTPRRHMRIVAGDRVLLWAKGKHYYEGVWLLAAPSAARPALPVPPITVADVRAVRGAPGSTAWLTDWARYFADALVASPSSILHDGMWELSTSDGRLRDRRATSADAQGILDVHGAHLDAPTFETWMLTGSLAIIPLRAPSAEDASRVKALRKLARDGTLPPLLLWFVSGLDMFVILDGHDRLAAARLENVPIARIAVSAIGEYRRWRPGPQDQLAELSRAEATMDRVVNKAGYMPSNVLDGVNARLVMAFAEISPTFARTRAYAMPGGAAAWEREVAARLAEIGAAPDHPILAG